MTKLLLVFGTFICFIITGFSQITFNPTAGSTGFPGGTRPTIFITGPTTGDQLRTFISANPANFTRVFFL